MNYLQKRKGQLKSGQLQIEKYQLSERRLDIHNKSAVLSGVIETKGVLNGTGFVRKIRVTNFWIKEDGQWKRAGFHDSRIE